MADLTANDEIHDALVRRQAYITQYINGLQSQFSKLLDGTEPELRAAIEQRLSEIAGVDGTFAFDDGVHDSLGVLAQNISDIRGAAIGDAHDMLQSEATDFAVSEADHADAVFNKYSPVTLDTVLPDVSFLASIVTNEPMQGRVLSDWASSLAVDDTNRIMDTIRVGMAQGSTTDQIIKSILGTRALNGADGSLEATRRNAGSITQTAIATVANQARQAYYVANSDIIDEEMWVATLDPDTCPICAALDGERFPVGEGDQPPEHWNCRCVRVAALDGEAVGNRPYTTATEDQLDGMTEEERAAAVSDMTGQLPASMTYQDWLERQSSDFQDHVLGPTRAQLFRDGMKLDGFVNNGRVLTLDELNNVGPQLARRTADITENGLHAYGEAASKAVTNQWIADSPVRSVADLYANAEANNTLLQNVANDVADKAGVTFKSASIKGEKRVIEKLAMGSKTPASITDIVRGTFPAETWQQADAISAELSKAFPMVDEGMHGLDTGYFDRPLKIRFPDGTMGEILVAPQALIDAKSATQGGHDLYVKWRSIEDKNSPEALALMAQQRALYGKAQQIVDKSWTDLLSKTARVTPGQE